MTDMQTEIAEIRTQLDRQAKWLKWSTMGWVAVLSLTIMGAAYSGLSKFDEITVKRLALVDSKGIERLILATDSKTVRVNGNLLERGPAVSGLILQNQNGDETGGMITGDNGMAAIMLDGYSKQNKYGMSERVGLVSLADGTAGLLIVDLKGNQRAKLMTGEDGNAVFDMLSAEGKPRISGRVTAEGSARWTK